MIDDLNAWTNEEVRTQIEILKPAGSTFVCERDPVSLFWVTRFELGDPPTMLWSDASPDERLALFNAFGWAWMKNQPQLGPGSRWHRGQELTREVVTKKVSLRGHTVPDPEDLDPSEVQAVYEKTRPRK